MFKSFAVNSGLWHLTFWNGLSDVRVVWDYWNFNLLQSTYDPQINLCFREEHLFYRFTTWTTQLYHECLRCREKEIHARLVPNNIRTKTKEISGFSSGKCVLRRFERCRRVVIILLRIREVQGLNLDQESDFFVSDFFRLSSVPQIKPRQFPIISFRIHYSALNKLNGNNFNVS